MDALFLARLQFAATTIYHFFFVPLTLGLSLLVAAMETMYVRTGEETYRRMTKFWGKLFIINFAMGVVTGIVQEFQFGMNWSEYSRFVGDIFGAPLAIEALLAFFLESTFLGVWIFGWDKLSRGAHAAAMWLVAISANISALWILIANSFMQQPSGMATDAAGKALIDNGRLLMNDFGALVFNPNIFTQFPHVVFSGLTTGALFILGISAYHLLRKTEPDVFRRSFQWAAVVGLIAATLVAFTGHSQGQHMVQTQPMKMAAAEALWESENPASFSLFTIGSLDGTEEVWAVRLPAMLSFLSYNRFTGEVKGMNELQAIHEAQYGPGDYTPHPFLPYWSFRAMVGAGMLMIALCLFALLFIVRAGQYDRFAWLLKWLPFSIALPYLANTAGWLLTEVGRYPWVVYGLLKIQDGVSTVVPAGAVWATLIGYVLLYGLLMGATVYLLAKYAKAGPAASV
ncbi:MAG: cytochrome ubiquinol oxidase subunit I [Chloroflexota bacterium]